MKVKRVLLRRLGFLKEEKPADEATLAKYAAWFKRPLVEDIVQAFADFYGWRIPSVGGTLQHAGGPRLVEI
ncbi:hypothetical protein D1007_12824 [Hordeum vulgare]|nr:hypothetical protein D1007_12824 [Hordeum vulgare]